jgi:hypothetical protein
MTASTPITAADLIHAPRFLGSIILSSISISGLLELSKSKKFFKSLKFFSCSAEILASGSCLILFDISKGILFP